MNPAVLLIHLAVVAVGLAVYGLWKHEQRRLAVWQGFAQARGWTYDPGKDRSLSKYFVFAHSLGAGRNRYASDAFRGEVDGRPIVTFTHHHQTTNGTGDSARTQHHWRSVFALQIERSFPELTIAPEHAGSRLIHMVTGSDIDFDSVEFSRRFQVKCRDKKFAYDFCNSAMIDYLLGHPTTSIELEGPWLLIVAPGKLRLSAIDPTLAHLSTIRGLMPNYLFA